MKKKLNNQFLFYLIPLLLGVITSFSLPPYNLFFLNFFTFPLFFICFIYNFKKKKTVCFITGWLFGFGYFISNIYWITNSLTFEEIFKPLIPIALFIIPLFLGLFYGLATYVCSFFKLAKDYSSVLLFALLISIFEYLRGVILGGFPWNLTAYSWTYYIDFLQILKLIGTYSFNLITITLFLMPTVFFFKKSLKSKIILAFSILFFVGINFYYGKYVINRNYSAQIVKLESKIKIVSPRIEIDRFFKSEDVSEIIYDLIKLSDPKPENTVFIFPEGIISDIFLENFDVHQKLFSDNFSKKHKIILGINSFENSKIYNSMAVLDNNLNILAKYNKNKLVPFGEYLPFEKFFKKIGLKKITQGYTSFSSSNDRNIIKIDDIKFLPLICYEIIYSGELKKSEEEFDLIINISEDGWFGNSIGPYQHFSHSVFRAIEEGKNLIRSTNGGISAYIDPYGNIIKKIKSTEKGVIEVKSYKKTEETFFSLHGNKIFFYFVIFYISLIFFITRKGR